MSVIKSIMDNQFLNRVIKKISAENDGKFDNSFNGIAKETGPDLTRAYKVDAGTTSFEFRYIRLGALPIITEIKGDGYHFMKGSLSDQNIFEEFEPINGRDGQHFGFIQGSKEDFEYDMMMCELSME